MPNCEKYGGECDGCMNCYPKHPNCPVCGKECDTFYKHGSDVVGCENCIEKVESYD